MVLTHIQFTLGETSAVLCFAKICKTCEATPVPHADGNEREIPWMLFSESAWIFRNNFTWAQKSQKYKPSFIQVSHISNLRSYSVIMTLDPQKNSQRSFANRLMEPRSRSCTVGRIQIKDPSTTGVPLPGPEFYQKCPENWARLPPGKQTCWKISQKLFDDFPSYKPRKSMWTNSFFGAISKCMHYMKKCEGTVTLT